MQLDDGLLFALGRIEPSTGESGQIEATDLASCDVQRNRMRSTYMVCKVHILQKR